MWLLFAVVVVSVAVAVATGPKVSCCGKAATVAAVVAVTAPCPVCWTTFWKTQFDGQQHLMIAIFIILAAN